MNSNLHPSDLTADTSSVRSRMITWPSDEDCLRSLLTIRYVTSRSAKAFVSKWAAGKAANDIVRQGVKTAGFLSGAFGIVKEQPLATLPATAVKKTAVTWQTDANGDHEPADEITVDDLPSIMTRVDKDKALQKARTKAKAEVFTPSWVCAKMNGEVDARILLPDDDDAEDPFGRIASESHEVTNPRSRKTKKVTTFWFEPSAAPIDCSALDSKPGSGDGWVKYVTDRRLEITCGEAPYLCSRYDATTGEPIPVLGEINGETVYMRHGLLDRKLRVISEQTAGLKASESGDEYSSHWLSLAVMALRSCYGYEWQGDSLLLARANMVTDVIEWWRAVCWDGDEERDLPIGVERALWEVTSWNVWQADGLKCVLPMSCKGDCPACAAGRRQYVGHDGRQCVIRMWTPTVPDPLSYETICPGPADGEIILMQTAGGLGDKLVDWGNSKRRGRQ